MARRTDRKGVIMYKAVVFDVGGTLMEYRGMPNVWLDFYPDALDTVNRKLSLDLTEEEAEKSLQILRSYNPTVNYREREYSPRHIFGEVTASWTGRFDLDEVIKEFFLAFGLKAYTYPESERVLGLLRSMGYKICTLTDVATAMPDEMHIGYFSNLMPYFDMYVSSQSCGYRKPNPKGLTDIAEKFSLDRREMIFAGDEKKDIETAKRFGCTSVLINRKNTSQDFGQDYTIADLEELLGILS